MQILTVPQVQNEELFSFCVYKSCPKCRHADVGVFCFVESLSGTQFRQIGPTCYPKPFAASYCTPYVNGQFTNSLYATNKQSNTNQKIANHLIDAFQKLTEVPKDQFLYNTLEVCLFKLQLMSPTLELVQGELRGEIEFLFYSY